MGLDTVRNKNLGNALRELGHWRVPAVLAVLATGFALLGAGGRELFKYDRFAIAGGQIWRLVSAHLVHLGLPHLLLNVAGLALVWVLVGRQYTTLQWCFVIAISLVVIDAGFWVLDPNLLWYVGLSGLLHALLLAGVLPAFRESPVEAGIIGMAVIAKLTYEQLAGPLPGSEASAGGDVITNAHLYGAIGGIVSAIILRRSADNAASI